MLINQKIIKLIQQKKYLPLDPTTNRGAYIAKHFKDDRLGTYFIVSKPESEPYNQHDRYNLDDIFSFNDAPFIADIYQVDAGLVIIPRVQAPQHVDGFLPCSVEISCSQALNLNEVANRTLFWTYYLDHNLYWNGRHYRLRHDTYFKRLLPSFKRSQMKARNQIYGLTLTALAVWCLPVFKRITFKHFKDWKTTSQVFQPLKQTNMFKKSKPSHCLRNINPSRFVRQLAITNKPLNYFVQSQIDPYETEPVHDIDTNPTQTDWSKFRINGNLETEDANIKCQQQVKDIFSRHALSSKPASKRQADEKLEPLFDNESLWTKLPHEGIEDKSGDNVEFVTDSSEAIPYLAHRLQKHHVFKSVIATTTQFGPHLFDTVFSTFIGCTAQQIIAPRPVYTRLNWMEIYQIGNDPKSFHANLVTDHPTARTFGDPKKIKYVVYQIPDGYDEETPQIVLMPEAMRSIVQNGMDGLADNPGEFAKFTSVWLKRNAGYRKFIASIQ